MAIETLDMLARMGTAVLLGGVIGYEREHARRQAGFRTHIVVALASATFMLVSTQFAYFQRYPREGLIVVDASRIAASVVTGIGFLGAGAIIKTGIGIRGLTTAASLWLVASVGLASGAGMYLVAGAATGASLFALLVLRRFEHKEASKVRRRFILRIVQGGTSRKEVVGRFESHGAIVDGVDLDRSSDSEDYTLVVDVSLSGTDELERLVGDLEGCRDVRRLRVERRTGYPPPSA